MTLNMQITSLRGFLMQYYIPAVEHLTNVVSARSPTHNDLYEVCNSISPNFQHCLATTTTDNYSWFEGLEHDLDEQRIAILFPQFHDSKPDRAINVYSNGRVNPHHLSDLLERIAYQFALKIPAKAQI